MKNISLQVIFTLLFLFSPLFSCAPEVTVPKTVIDVFASKFEQASSIEWKKESQTEWEAEFVMNGINYSAKFDINGKWLETENEIEIQEIPKVILSKLNAEFPKYKIEIAEVSKTTKGIFYEFELERDAADLEVVISDTGEVVKKGNDI